MVANGVTPPGLRPDLPDVADIIAFASFVDVTRGWSLMATSLADVLNELHTGNGLAMAAVVSADGLVVEAAADAEVDVESICSVASNGLLMMDALGQELGEGAARVTTLEYEDHLVVLAPLDDEDLLVVLAHGGMNLGRLRIVLRRFMPQLSQALGSV